MDAQSWQMWRTLARYVIFLAVMLLAAASGALYMVIELLPDDAPEKAAIVTGITVAIGAGLSGMISAVGAGFVVLVNARRNVSVSEAQGGPAAPPTP